MTGPVDGGAGGGFRYPHPLDPDALPGRGGLDFLGPDTQEKMVQNILAVYDDTVGDKAWVREAGKSWYPAARQWLFKILEMAGSDMDPDRAASVLAQFSQDASWPVNMQSFMDWLQGSKSAHKYSQVNQVAERIRASDNPLTAGQGQKIYNFLRAILGDKRYPDAVAVDRWAERIALGVTDKKELWDTAKKLKGKGSYKSPEGFNFTRGYDAMADAYQQAARLRAIPVSEMQAVTWIHSGPGSTDSSIREFAQTNEWRFRVFQDTVAELALEDIKANEGTTIDLSTHRPTSGYAYAPKKTTEDPVGPDELSRSRILQYIRTHLKDLKQQGNYLGAWTRGDGKVVLDVSRVGPASSDTIAAAMKAKQEGIWDFGAPDGQQELLIGEMVDGAKGKQVYRPLGTPDDLHAAHQGKFGVKASAPTVVEEAPPTGKPVKPIKPSRAGRLGSLKLEPDRPGRAGPGAAMQRQRTPIPETLGKVGRGAGLVITGAGDVLMAYGLVGQAAQQGIEEQLRQGNAFVQRGNVLGIPQGQAFADPTMGAHSASTVGRSKAELDFWMKYGHFPDEQPGDAGGTLIPLHGNTNGGMQSGGYAGLQMHSDFSIQHADGSVTDHKLVATPNGYAAQGPVPFGPGDEIRLNGTY